MNIHIDGWARSFKEWADAGYPGARSFNANGEAFTNRRPIRRCQWPVYQCTARAEPRHNYCIPHFKVIRELTLVNPEKYAGLLPVQVA